MKQTATYPSDWLSVMLVKELREELRTRVFVGSCLLLHTIMVISLVFSIFGYGSAEKEIFGSSLFWIALGIPLLFGIPKRGSAIVEKELKANTLELIFLTNLSGWKILLGKWLTLFLESTIIVSSALPYFLIRYFLGRVDLITEISVLSYLFMLSITLSAARIWWTSSRKYKADGKTTFASAVFLLVALYGSWWLLSAMVHFLTKKISIGTTFLWVVVCSVVILELLLFAAGKISPGNENYASRKRLLALAIIALGWGLFYSSFYSSYGTAGANWERNFFDFCFICSLLPIFVGALNEHTIPHLSVYTPFVKKGSFGKLFGRLFYPGWASGAFFTLIAVGLGTMVITVRETLSAHDFLRSFGFTIVFMGWLFFPLALVQIFLPPIRRTLRSYLGIQIIVFILLGVGSLFLGNSKNVFSMLFSPFTALMGYNPSSWLSYWKSSLVIMALAALSIIIVILNAIRELRIIVKFEKQAQEHLTKGL